MTAENEKQGLLLSLETLKEVTDEHVDRAAKVHALTKEILKESKKLRAMAAYLYIQQSNPPDGQDES